MMELSIRTKSYAVIILMLSCFALLYPKILHPMLLHILGLRTVEPMQDDFIHPRDRHMALKSNTPKPPHPGHHPGRVVSHESPSGRSGVMTMVLPVYAIGIVFYLLYTLVKVFGGSKDNKKKLKRESILKNYYRDFHYDPNAGDFKMRYNNEERDETSPDNPEDVSYRYRPTEDIYNTARTLPHDLEHLLQKVDEKNINENEMHQLKVRLEETETQLTRILLAMERLERKSTTDTVVDNNGDSPVEMAADDEVQELYEDCEEIQDNSTDNPTVLHRRSTKTAPVVE